ncbi:hypothetical protein niasHS_015330 [Heterodera schachtii]|uniref:Uncharacterized protein n=1 Tax=Heterodera schachtii TaxID=97005 RepID=A0ABD2IAE2_HETSC
MGGNIRITFIDECQICSQNELTMSKLITMSPQQISQMRRYSDKSDGHRLTSESFCMFLLQNSVNKMLFSAEKLQIRTDFPRGFVKEMLSTPIPKRELFDGNGQLLKLAAN